MTYGAKQQHNISLYNGTDVLIKNFTRGLEGFINYYNNRLSETPILRRVSANDW